MIKRIAFNSILTTFLYLGGCASFMENTSTEAWIDVRTPAEYAQSSISGHANIPHTEITMRIADLVTDKSAPINLYCGSGRRAGLAKQALEEMGYTNVTNAGGIEEVRMQLDKN